MKYKKLITIIFVISMVLSFYRMSLENLWDDGYWQYTQKIESAMTTGENIHDFMQGYIRSNRILFPFVAALISIVVVNAKIATLLLCAVSSFFMLRVKRLLYRIQNIGNKETVYAILMFFTASTTISNMVRPRSDMFGIMFVLLSILMILKYNKERNIKYGILMSLSITAAIMTREVFVPLFLIPFISLKKLRVREIPILILPIVIFAVFLLSTNILSPFVSNVISISTEHGGLYHEITQYNTPNYIIKWIIFMFSFTPLLIFYDMIKNYKKRFSWLKTNLRNPCVLWVILYFILIVTIRNTILEDKILWLPIAPIIYLYVAKIVTGMEKINRYGRYLIILIMVSGYLIFLAELGWKIYFDNLWSSNIILLNLTT